MYYIFSGLPLYENPIKNLNHIFIGLTLISLYFSKIPYLYGYLNYEEVEILLKEKILTKQCFKITKELKKTNKYPSHTVSVVQISKEDLWKHQEIINWIKLKKKYLS